MEKIECKTCQHAEIMFERDKKDRFSTSYKPSGWVLCSSPRYSGRAFFVRDRRRHCRHYLEHNKRKG